LWQQEKKEAKEKIQEVTQIVIEFLTFPYLSLNKEALNLMTSTTGD